MIVPMKKAAVIVQSKDAEEAIRALRSLGVLHVEHQNLPTGPDITFLRDDIALAQGAIGILSSPEFSRHGPPAEEGMHVKEWKLAARHVVESWKRLDQLEEYSRHLKTSIKEWERWGEFKPDEIMALASKDIHVRLYEIPAKELKNLPPGLTVKTIFASGGMAGCAVISRGKADIHFKEIALPKMSLSVMNARLNEEAAAIRAIRENMIRHLAYFETFNRIKKALEKELEFHEALEGMGRADKLVYITGYLPSDAAERLVEKSKEERWGFTITDPSDTDNIPTLVRTPKWVSIVKPVFKLLEILPGYRELDISPLFLLFLGLFFGMIIGDAGYGALYMSLTFLAQKKFGKKSKDTTIFRLFYFFSACAIFWGILTGTVFGQEWYLKSGFKPLMPVLNDTRFLQAFCFLLGAFHLTLGHAWQAVRKAPSLTALADAGWIMVLWSAFFFAKTLILNDPLPRFINFLLIGGVSLVILFTNPQKNILKAMGDGLGTVALSIMNNFTDVVSYVRLFAVGLAGVAISDTVNTLASVFGGDNILLRIAIVFIGHTINIVLGPISVLVHGIRLNVLEFSGHAGLTWSGIPYKPLNNKSEENYGTGVIKPI